MATPATDTELREVLNAVNALSQRVEVGFAQVDAKLAETKAELKGEIQRVETKMEVGFAQVDTKLSDLRGEMNTKLAKIEGDIALIRQPRDFGEFVKRAIVSGVTVTVIGGLLLAAWKLLIFGVV